MVAVPLCPICGMLHGTDLAFFHGEDAVKHMEEQWMSAEYRAAHMHAELHQHPVDGCNRCRIATQPSTGELEDMFGVDLDDWREWEDGLEDA